MCLTTDSCHAMGGFAGSGSICVQWVRQHGGYMLTDQLGTHTHAKPCNRCIEMRSILSPDIVENHASFEEL